MPRRSTRSKRAAETKGTEVDFSQVAKTIRDTPLEDELGKDFLKYSKSVITSRALPDVRDGLKPVQRRILWAMYSAGYLPNKPTVKSLRVVAETSKYHAHGDASIYQSQVTLARPFVMPLTMIDIQGSVGTDWDDAPAAARYTEARLAKDALLCLEEVREQTVGMLDNYDGTEQEPEVLPVEFPLLPINGSQGIAVGMTTNIPQNNPTEIMQATRYLLFHPNATTEKLMEFIKGPDFPDGGQVIGADNLLEVYETGHGSILLRADVSVRELSGGQHELTFTGIPYGTSVNKCLGAIRKARIDGKITEISKSDNLSDRRNGTQLVVVTKRGANPNVIISQLYKYTPLESNFGVVFNVIADGKPRYMGIKEMLQSWIDFRRETVRNRTQHRYDKAAARMHMIGALQKILADVDEVIRIVRTSDNRQAAHEALKRRYKIDDDQADYVLSISLGRLTKFDRIQLEDEAKGLQAQMDAWRKVLDDPKVLDRTIAAEMDKVAKQIARERRTTIVGGSVDEHRAALEAQAAGPAEIPVEDCTISLARSGEVWRSSASTRGKGVKGMLVCERDVRTDTELLVVTNMGRSTRIRAVDVTVRPMDSSKLMTLGNKERVVGIVPLEGTWEDRYKTLVTLVTATGLIKVLDTSTLTKTLDCDVMKLTGGDEVIYAEATPEGADCTIVTSSASLLTFPLSGVRAQGRTGGGVAGIRLAVGARILCVNVSVGTPATMVVTTTGKTVKISPLDQYPKKGRATLGVRCHRFLSGETALTAAYVGEDPSIVVAGKEVLPLPRKARSKDGSGTKPEWPGKIELGRRRK